MQIGTQNRKCTVHGRSWKDLTLHMLWGLFKEWDFGLTVPELLAPRLHSVRLIQLNMWIESSMYFVWCFDREDLLLGHSKQSWYKQMESVCLGDRNANVRAREPESGLSVESQVLCLIDQATDANILGRTWQGWEPWMWLCHGQR